MNGDQEKSRTWIEGTLSRLETHLSRKLIRDEVDVLFNIGHLLYEAGFTLEVGSQPLVAYRLLEEKRLAARSKYQGEDSEEEDAIMEEMDTIWHQLTLEQTRSLALD